jgi:hypothetical protein
MRAFAFDVGLVADRLGTLGESTAIGASCAAWDGPAAVEFHGNLQEIAAGAKAVAGRLHALVGYLLQQATALEAEQDAARRRIEALERMNQAKTRQMAP